MSIASSCSRDQPPSSASSGLTSEAAIRKKYRLPDDVWEGLGNDDELVEAIEARKRARIVSGTCARERAQQIFSTAPDVLGKILNAGDDVSPRHKIESARELRAISANTGPENAPTSDERFIIRIDLTAGGNKDDVIVIDKPTRKVGPDVSRTIEHDDMPLLAAIAASKSRNGGDGEPL